MIKDNNGVVRSILKEKSLSLEERFMLITLNSLDKYGDGIVSCRYEELMECLCTTRRAKVSNILKSLKDQQFIDIKRNGRSKNEYRLLKDYMIELTIEKNNLDSCTDDTRIVANEKQSYTTVQENIERDKRKIDINNIKNRSSKSGTLNNCCSTKSETIKDDLYINNKNIDNKINNINNNNNTENIRNIEICRDIVELWNIKDIGDKAILNNKTVEAINDAVKVYGVINVRKGIDNYSKVFYSQYYYNHQWDFMNFLSRNNGISRFQIVVTFGKGIRSSIIH